MVKRDFSQHRNAEVQGRYAPLAARILDQHDVHVINWSRNGYAWKAKRAIQSPHPRTPLTLAVLLHEVAHIVLPSRSRRYLEEMDAWEWAFQTMRTEGVAITDATYDHARAGLGGYLQRWKRLGVQPDMLDPYWIALVSFVNGSEWPAKGLHR